MTDKLAPGHIAWCKMIFSVLAPNGRWGVPRSGLLFQKRGNELVLVAEMPWASERARSRRRSFANFQDDDYELTKRHFEAAGVPVRKELDT